MRVKATPLYAAMERSVGEQEANRLAEVGYMSRKMIDRLPWGKAMRESLDAQEPELVSDIALGVAYEAMLDDPDGWYDRRFELAQAAVNEVSRTVRPQYVTYDNDLRRINYSEAAAEEYLSGRTPPHLDLDVRAEIDRLTDGQLSESRLDMVEAYVNTLNYSAAERACGYHRTSIMKAVKAVRKMVEA